MEKQQPAADRGQQVCDNDTFYEFLWCLNNTELQQLCKYRLKLTLLSQVIVH